MRNPLDRGPRTRTDGHEAMPKQSRRHIYIRLLSYLGSHKLLLALAMVLTVLSSMLSISGTSLAGSAIAELANVIGGAHSRIFFYLGLMLAFYLVSFVISYLLSLLMTRVAQNIAKRMRNDIYSSLLRLPVGFFDAHQAGELVSTVSYDVNSIDETLSHDFLQIVSGVATIIYSFILMLLISPVLILVFCLTIPLSVILTSTIGRISRPHFRRRSAAFGELNGYVEDIVAGQKTVRTYGAEEAHIGAFSELNRAAKDAYVEAEKCATLSGPSVNFINNLSLALVNIFGAVLLMSDLPIAISLAGLAQFILLSRKFSGPINQIAGVYSDIQSSLAAAERVFRLIDEPPEPPDSEGVSIGGEIEGNVEFRDVSFGYLPSCEVIHGLSFTARPGSVTAIVGPTGAGKSTLISLLMRFYDISSGDILLDGRSIYSYPRAALRGAFTMVLQDTWLRTGTFYENIAYGKSGATLDEVISAAKRVGMHDYIMSQPQGYESEISESGANISKGQKQLLTIARAMLRDSKMLILDEATSNVDSKTERDISEAMLALMQGKTSFVIAHRLSTVRRADNILVVNDGDVVESGTHEQLLLRHGLYYDIYNSQFTSIDTNS